MASLHKLAQDLFNLATDFVSAAKADGAASVVQMTEAFLSSLGQEFDIDEKQTHVSKQSSSQLRGKLKYARKKTSWSRIRFRRTNGTSEGFAHCCAVVGSCGTFGPIPIVHDDKDRQECEKNGWARTAVLHIDQIQVLAIEILSQQLSWWYIYLGRKNGN